MTASAEIEVYHEDGTPFKCFIEIEGDRDEYISCDVYDREGGKLIEVSDPCLSKRIDEKGGELLAKQFSPWNHND